MKRKYMEDLKYLYEKLKKHPSFLMGWDIENFKALFEKVNKNVADYDSLVHSMELLTTFFKDGHTNIEIPYTNQDECLKIVCQWVKDKLILTEKYEDIKAGTEIVAIENLKVKEMLGCAAQYIPHENIFLVKSRMTEYPYMNYHMFSKMNLVRLFGEKEFYEVTFKIGSVKKVTRCVLEKYDGFLAFKKNLSHIMKFKVIRWFCIWMNVFVMSITKQH